MASIPGTTPIFGPIIDLSGELPPATSALRDAGVLSLREGKIQKVNSAGDAWIDLPAGHTKFVGHTDTPSRINPAMLLKGNNSGTALEFQRLPESFEGIKQVTIIPTVFDRPLLNLLYNDYQSSGNVSDARLTPGHIPVPKFFGYSDGTLRPAIGSISSSTNRPALAWIEGTGTFSAGSITAWTPKKLGSRSESWLKSIGNIWINGWRFVVTNYSYYGGWEAEIVNSRDIPHGRAVTLNTDIRTNQRATTGAHSWLANNALRHRAGLYWWDGSRYKLIEGTTARYRGEYAASDVQSYQVGDIYVIGGLAYLITAIANAVITAIPMNLPDIVNVTGSGHPAITDENRDKLFVDHDAPRLWVPHWIPQPSVPATAASTPWVHAKFDGARIFEPLEADSAIGDIFYNTARSIWERRVLNTGTAGRWELSGITAATSNKTNFPGTYVWLGQQVNSNAAANRVLGNAMVAAHTYLYLNTTSGKVEQITASTFVPAGSPGYDYESDPVLLAKELEAWARVGDIATIPIARASNAIAVQIENAYGPGSRHDFPAATKLKLTPRTLASKILVELLGGEVIVAPGAGVTASIYLRRGAADFAEGLYASEMTGTISVAAIVAPASVAEQTFSLQATCTGTALATNIGGTTAKPLIFKATELG